MNHTKGEWKVKQKKPTEANFFDGFILLVEDERLLIALCDREGWDNHKERLANAHLIAAAPENYEANLETLRIFRDLRDNHEALWNHLIEEYPDIVNHWDKIKKALAKAKGKEEK